MQKTRSNKLVQQISKFSLLYFVNCVDIVFTNFKTFFTYTRIQIRIDIEPRFITLHFIVSFTLPFNLVCLVHFMNSFFLIFLMVGMGEGFRVF